jgi:hypothetical protein
MVVLSLDDGVVAGAAVEVVVAGAADQRVVVGCSPWRCP